MPGKYLTRPMPLTVVLYLCARIPLIIALPFDGLRGYGDLAHFYNLAQIPGLPYLNYWIEFPPGFAFLNEALYALAGGVEHTYTYLFLFLLFTADIGSVLLFTRIEKILYPKDTDFHWRGLVYAVILASLPYAWQYYDSLAIFFTLLAIYLFLQQNPIFQTGTSIALGMLVKFFPVLLLPSILQSTNPRRVITIIAVVLVIFLSPFIILYQINPSFTSATLAAQSSRGSLETVWALIDGNLRTGGFGPLVERLDPKFAYESFRNPPAISPYFLLFIFGSAGFYLWFKAKLSTSLRILAFYGLTQVIFFLWSPAWSPQWILHLLPVMLLVLPFSPGLLLTAALVLVNLVEWPLLLSRGLFQTLPLTILARLGLMLLLGWMFYREAGIRQPVLHPPTG